MNIIHFDTIDSTNTYLKNNYQVLDDMSFVSASYQSMGRGRNNRLWTSDKNKNLMFSFLIKDEILINKYHEISIIVAYTILEILKEYGLNDVAIKWPNDVYVKDEKICGILLESISLEKMECLIVGVGLNVNQDKFPDNYIHPATSVFKQLNREIEIEILKDKIYQRIIINMNKIKDDYNFYLDIKNHDYLKDKKANAFIHNEVKNVIVEGINEDYTLTIKYDDKKMKINAGEITFHV